MQVGGLVVELEDSFLHIHRGEPSVEGQGCTPYKLSGDCRRHYTSTRIFYLDQNFLIKPMVDLLTFSLSLCLQFKCRRRYVDFMVSIIANLENGPALV